MRPFRSPRPRALPSPDRILSNVDLSTCTTCRLATPGPRILFRNGLLRNYSLFSCFRDRQELEAESSCLLAETHFSSLLCLFITTVEDGFCVRFLG